MNSETDEGLPGLSSPNVQVTFGTQDLNTLLESLIVSGMKDEKQQSPVFRPDGGLPQWLK